ncbi:hypothetical protein [Paludibacterium paludis]|uniref:Uncharacterized protein n=1 Tax=Paludibacterium paludis TaxID=1225769 RepID=A0A918P684_9NEIS|nr:hypothetical protein [Paludibacterium paludis]GGY21750.1 hypothetical protein GCM10011289_26830 [Paludibacterium paludis]
MKITLHIPSRSLPPDTAPALKSLAGNGQGSAGQAASPSYILSLGKEKTPADNPLYSDLLNGADSIKQQRKASISQRAAQLKEEIKSLRKMLAMATRENAKGFIASLARLSQELRSLVGALKGSEGDAPPSSVTTVQAGGGADAANGEQAQMDETKGDGKSADAPTTVSATGEEKTEADAGQGSVAVAAGASVDPQKDPDAALKGELAQMAGDLKAIHRHIKQLLKSAPPDRDTREQMEKIEKQLTDSLKALTTQENSESNQVSVEIRSGGPDVGTGSGN